MANKSTFLQLDHKILLDNTDSTQLCDEDIFDMMTALVNLFHKWKEIGTALGLRNYILEIIEAKCRTNVRLALQEVIVEFLRKNYNCDRFGDPSWRSLAKAVAHPVGGADVPIAMEIANAHPAKDQESSPLPVLHKDSDHIYSVGCPIHLLKYNWYYGQLSLVDAAKILISKGGSCFLVREDKDNGGTIVLSVKGEGGVAHLTVSRGPGWYAVEGTAKQFETVAELVMYYQTNSLADTSNLLLGVPCIKNNSSTSAALSNTSEGLYDVGAPSELLKHNWYSGKLTREAAQEKLSATEDSRFLVWVDDHSELFLSLKRPNETSHLNIERGPGWYSMEGTFQLFPSVVDLVHYYNLDLFPAAPDVATYYNLNGNFQSGLGRAQHVYDYIDMKTTQFHQYAYIRMGEHSKHEYDYIRVGGEYSKTGLEVAPAPDRWRRGTECVGIYNYPGGIDSTNDLPFQKGDTLTIINASKDPNWYKARRPDGQEGLVPINYIQAKKPPTRKTLPPPRGRSVAAPAAAAPVKLNSMPWFHGKITRQEAERLLYNSPGDGRFIVRESQNFNRDYTLSVYSGYSNQVEHYRVRRYSTGQVTLDDEFICENLLQLVEHYQKDADGLCTRLKFSVDKTKDVEYVVNMQDFKDRGWTIPKKHLNKKSLIRKGEFGEVWLGEYQGAKVAIKMLEDLKASRKLLEEASVMTTLQHPNLVSLIGVSLDDDPIYLVTEFMAKGPLVDYLRSRGRAVVTKQRQLDFSRDVCKGMVYLEANNFVHRDLAAHNVHISEDGTAKVANFGLTREVHSQSKVTKLLPVKWTAPEALQENKFSNKSDVWSFGILLWEIYSYGRTPYPQVTVEDVPQYVELGYRMDPPDGCQDAIYRIMQEAWKPNPSHRPNFALVDKQLASISAAW